MGDKAEIQRSVLEDFVKMCNEALRNGSKQRMEPKKDMGEVKSDVKAALDEPADGDPDDLKPEEKDELKKFWEK